MPTVTLKLCPLSSDLSLTTRFVPPNADFFPSTGDASRLLSLLLSARSLSCPAFRTKQPSGPVTAQRCTSLLCAGFQSHPHPFSTQSPLLRAGLRVFSQRWNPNSQYQ